VAELRTEAVTLSSEPLVGVLVGFELVAFGRKLRNSLYGCPMANTFLGLYRTVTGAYVTNDTMAFQVPEVDYRAFGYEPNYDELPWKEDYDAGKSAQLPSHSS
jgi:hypothetical protein